MSKKVLVIGWDAADWQIIDPLIAAGKMPTLQKLIKGGVRGNLSTMNPPYSPMLWTSVATGKTPDKHGVLGFIEIDAEKQQIRPVTVRQRKVRALWNIFHNQGMKSNLVGWWPTHPAEPINGAVVSDLFPKAIGGKEKEWPLAPGSIHPKSLEKELTQFRIHPHELTEAHILPFIPKAQEIEDDHKKSLDIFVKIMAHNTSLHACSTWLQENTEWDFMAIYYDLIDHFCHAFMKFHPPKLPAIQEEQYEIFKDVINSAYRFQDMMLERTLELIDDDTLVIVMSDHGYVSDNSRLLTPPDVHAGPALEHREFGIFVMNGPGVKKGQNVFGTSLLDVTPTILNYFDLPIGADMDGRVMMDAFEELPPIKMIDSWENEPGDFGLHGQGSEEDVLSAQAAMEQLIELGYVDRPDSNVEKAIHKTKCELRFNLARVYMGKQEFDKAEEILLDLIQEETEISHFLVDLVQLSLIKEDYASARKYLEQLRENDPKSRTKTQLTEAKILFGEGKVPQGKKILEELSKRQSLAGASYFELGKLYMRLEEYPNAKENFEQAIEHKPNNAKYHHALATVYLRLGALEDALNHGLTSIELVRYFPDAHYTIGQILEKMGDLDSANQAYATAEKLRPKLKRARIAKENIEKKKSKRLGHDETSDFPEITIVSGLPRSGTSMMMQMLNAGGLVPLTDGVRKEDSDNPKGYFEYEKTKSLHKNNDWVGEAEGKVIKVIAQLLKHLPVDYRYKIVFMTRDLDEVLASQTVMLKNNNVQPKEGVKKAFNTELKKLDDWFDREPGVEVLKVPYSGVIEDPRSQAELIQQFLGKKLDIEQMVDQVSSDLYRNRILKF